MKKVISIVFTILTLSLLLLSIFSYNHTSIFGFRMYKVMTGSMEPSIHVSDTIMIKESDNYKKGDIVTYKDGDEYVTHRIVSVNEDNIITKGDANNTEDSPIKEKDIIGKVIFKMTMLGFLVYLLNKPIIWILVFIIGILIIFVIPDKEGNENSGRGKKKKEKENN